MYNYERNLQSRLSAGLTVNNFKKASQNYQRLGVISLFLTWQRYWLSPALRIYYIIYVSLYSVILLIALLFWITLLNFFHQFLPPTCHPVIFKPWFAEIDLRRTCEFTNYIPKRSTDYAVLRKGYNFLWFYFGVCRERGGIWLGR
jgi:hypothetical protein